MSKSIIKSHSPEETREVGEKIGRLLKPGDVITLEGDLGSGKTCFVQGLSRGLGVPADSYVRSPTYTLLNIHKGRLPLYHFDLYRLNDMTELDAVGFREYLDGHGVCAIEWASNVPDAMPENCINVSIRQTGDNDRELEIKASRNNHSFHRI